MNQYLRASFWQHAIREPLTWLAMTVDFVPVILVLFYGWGAMPLVLLYWAENVIIGVVTFFRILAAGAYKGTFGLMLGLFLALFFSVHYGMFCFGHGVFIFSFADMTAGGATIGLPGPNAIIDMMSAIVEQYPGAIVAMGLIFAYQLVAAVIDYWPGQSGGYDAPEVEMFSPYGRIVILHVGVFAGAFALLAIGDPAIGVLALIALRMAFSVFGRAWRDRNRQAEPAAA